MELKDTVDLMLSSDYRDRFRAEYYQTKIRFDKLIDMMQKWENNTLSFVPSCSKEDFSKQLFHMRNYLTILEKRAILEKIEL